MKSTLTIFALLILTLSAVAEPPKIIAGPYLQHTTQTTMAIMWETDQPCVGGVLYDKVRFRTRGDKKNPDSADLMKQKATSSELRTIHEFTLSNLEPQTDYIYQVVGKTKQGERVESERYIFQTAVRADSAYAFVVMGDSRTYPKRFKTLADLALAERPNFVINVGDVVSNGNDKKQWIQQYFAPAAELMKRVPTYVSIGNHERNAKWFYEYSSYPAPENYYSFDYGNAHFTIVDSNADLSPKSKQYQWLIADLAATKAKWKFVAHHHPPYSSDKDDYGDTASWLSARGDSHVKKLIPVYEKYGVDVVWTGHIHDYERTWPLREGKVDQENGVIYIQAGGGGAELEQFAPTRSWFTAKLLRNWQYCLVNIHGGTFQMMAYDIDGKLYDFFELKK